jgi:hemerythrin-like domain-containing protein
MTLVHNGIIRGLNSLYLQAPHLSPKDHADFILYCQGWSGLLHAHHHGEETVIFPTIEEKTGQAGIMEVNVSQHQSFQAGIESFDSYLASTSSNPAEFSGTRLVELIEDFAPALTQHLAEEIPTLIALRDYRDSLDITKLMDEEARKIMGTLDKTLILSFLTANLDHTFEDGAHADFPPAPWIVRKVLMPWIWAWPKRRLWRFSSTTTRGVPKELPFAPPREGGE